MTQPRRLDPKTAQQELSDHPRYKYRGCAEDPDDPRLAAGSAEVEVDGELVMVRVPVTAWDAPTVDGGEEKEVREARQQAAIDVCMDCPVMVQCLAYGSSLTREGKLAEPYAILGGMTALDRHKRFVGERKVRPVKGPAPVDQLRTPQKLAVLRALAVSPDEYRVAIETGLGVRKANWQRARLVSGLGLVASASRGELLAAAVEAGLLDGGLVVADDGSVPAIPPSTRKLLIEFHRHLLLSPSAPEEAWDWSLARPWRAPRGRRPVSMRSKFRSVEGQMALEVEVPPDEWAYVHDLFPQEPVLGVAA
ncbi:hypothetical protein [Streptomyces sp. NBC_00847]|uniref:hypothetical protein n=1 Tax=Streptomyces sp. NBC_00847 TaxID=2975850 RepID=UPI00225DDF09|nr:hypothetical protein [Streptomyces sp. NBC_00847]MCX4885956.1 WhiB family transcriptional regulator [Streptomyces sp. NBC_00847]